MAASGSETAHRLYERRNGVVVLVACLVVMQKALLHRVFDEGLRDMPHSIVVGSGGRCRKLKGVEADPCVAVCERYKRLHGLVVELRLERAKPALVVCHRSAQNILDVIVGQGLQREYAGARE